MQYSPKTEFTLKASASNALFFGGAVFGAISFLAALLSLFSGEFEGALSVLVFAVVMGALPMYIGWKGREKIKEKSNQVNIRKLEATLLNLAELNKGVLTRSTVAMRLKISVDEAQEILQYAISKNIAVVNFDDEGNVTYIFRDFLPKN